MQGRSLVPRLARLLGGPQQVAMFAWFGMQGGMWEMNGIRLYPAGVSAYGTDIIGKHAKHFEADVVISLIDVWTQEGVAEAVKPAKYCPWFPIDGEPVAERVKTALEGVALPLIYSRWGERLLKEAGIECAYVPHGIEPSMFKIHEDPDAASAPLAGAANAPSGGASKEVAAFRQALFPDAEHVTVMVAANKDGHDRKAFNQQLRAWRAFAWDKPGAILYIHTEPTTKYGGLDLVEICRQLEILPKVRFADSYTMWIGYPPEFLVMLYNCADVYLGAAKAEGFGLPIIESQACGTPVIVTEYSSMPELVRWGICVPPVDRYWFPIGTWWAWPDVEGIAAALQQLYDEQRKLGGAWPLELRAQVSAAIHEEYGWDGVVERYWKPVLERMKDEG